ncbi:MAG: cupin domain-containing protein [Clostridia bacterium]|nr:cupin domain-containing protein [Clostridia bacterium]
MKRLICAKDVEALGSQGRKVLYIDDNTIITPSAKDAARTLKIEFSTDTQPPSQVYTADSPCESAATASDGIDSNMIYTVLKVLADKGMLQGVMDSIANDVPYVSEKDSCGLKIVRGNSVKLEAFDTGNPDDRVFYQKMMSADDGCSMNAGFITIENCQFERECACEEIYYIVEGTLTVTVNKKTYTAQSGDSIFFPNGSKIALGSPNKMKAFYVTY